jgi:hypothetical protein
MQKHGGYVFKLRLVIVFFYTLLRPEAFGVQPDNLGDFASSLLGWQYAFFLRRRGGYATVSEAYDVKV